MGAHTVANHQMLMDVGVDPAGGTSYAAVVSNLMVGQLSTGFDGRARQFYLPIRIPNGSAVAVRVQSSHATPVAFRVNAKFYGAVSGMHAMPCAQSSEDVGTVGGSSTGTSFTPGNAADGSWTSLGTTTEKRWWWILGWSVSNTVITAERTYIDLAYGDGSNKQIMKRIVQSGSTSEETFEHTTANLLWYDCYFPVPAGATLYVRGRCENAPDTGYVANAVGLS